MIELSKALLTLSVPGSGCFVSINPFIFSVSCVPGDGQATAKAYNHISCGLVLMTITFQNIIESYCSIIHLIHVHTYIMEIKQESVNFRSVIYAIISFDFLFSKAKVLQARSYLY